LLGIGACILGVGCSTRGPREPKFIEDIRPIPPILKVTSYTIQRRDLSEALERVADAPIRLVPVYQSVSSTQTYEYRLFDVSPDGVYGLLGLENSDVIIAVDRYLLKNPNQFAAFVRLLTNENEATIEIRRGGEGRLLKYSFVPAVNLR
jgi:type II secretory pathway component PulC